MKTKIMNKHQTETLLRCFYQSSYYAVSYNNVTHFFLYFMGVIAQNRDYFNIFFYQSSVFQFLIIIYLNTPVE